MKCVFDIVSFDGRSVRKALSDAEFGWGSTLVVRVLGMYVYGHEDEAPLTAGQEAANDSYY